MLELDYEELGGLLTRGGTILGTANRGRFSAKVGHGEGRGLYDVRLLRTERHKLVYYPHDVDELYDVQEDPWELRNLAEEPGHRQLRAELQARLEARMAAAGDPLRHWMKQRLSA